MHLLTNATIIMCLNRSKGVFSVILQLRSKHCWTVSSWWEESYSKTYCLLGWKTFGSTRDYSCMERL